MKGWVDDKLRALLRLPVSGSHEGIRLELVVWIDTSIVRIGTGVNLGQRIHSIPFILYSA